MNDVVVSIVTWNSGDVLQGCLESLRDQSVPVAVRVFDNASSDRTVDVANRFGVKVLRSAENVGYARGHNSNTKEMDSPYVLFLNPDTRLAPDYVATLLDRFHQEPRIGSAGGKLFRMHERGEVVERDGRCVLDSTGIYFTPTLRHFDRGSEKRDLGQFDRRQYLFGITGAALFCRTKMLEDLVLDGEIFDEDFFAYREDADLAWRAQLRGWKAIYEPRAVGFHRRHVVPSRRRQLSEVINYHSLKNRFLMRLKNIDWAVTLKCFPFMRARDLAILAYVLTREQSSLRSYSEVRRLRPRFLEKRELVQATRTVSPLNMARWFSFKPVVGPDNS